MLRVRMLCSLLFLLELMQILINLSHLILHMVKIANFPFFLIRIKPIVVFLHELSLSGLLCQYSFNKCNFFIKQCNLIILIVILQAANLLHEDMQLVVN